jgi:hypothetical protein
LSTANLTTKIGRNDEPTPDPPTTSFLTGTFPQHSDPVLVTVTPSTVAHPPSVSVEQQGEFSKTPPTYYLEPYVVHSLDPDPNKRQEYNRVTCRIRHHSRLVHDHPSSLFYPKHQCHPTNKREIDRRPQLTLIATLQPPNSVIPTEPSPSVESAPVQPDHLSRPLGSPSSTLTTAHSHNAPQVPSVLDVRVGHETERIVGTPKLPIPSLHGCRRPHCPRRRRALSPRPS